MKLNDVMKETGLTKKAIYFYEEMGLVGPQKDGENNYREYSKTDVEGLIAISALRKLDFTVKEIQRVLAGTESLADAVQSKLAQIKGEIGRLQQNKNFLEQMDWKETGLNVLAKLAEGINNASKSIAGYMQKELERIMPGNVGKMFAIHYGQFLDEPLDTPEKEDAWSGLIGYLDAQEETQYPEDIRTIVEEMYGRIGEEEWPGFAQKAKTVTESVLNKNSVFSESEMAGLEQRMEEYCNTIEYQNFLKFQKYVTESLKQFFKDVEKYMNVLSSRFVKFNEVMRNMAWSMQK